MAYHIGCVLMAAGNARRFGSDKLLSTIGGKTLLRRAMESIPTACFSSVVVVTRSPEGIALSREFGFSHVVNTQPELGVSHTIRLGLQAVGHCDGVLFQVCDQPLLRRETVAALVALWQDHPDKIAALGRGGVRGNPCLFPARLLPELLLLQGDRGGSGVIRAHPEALLLMEADPLELSDVDNPAALERLREQES